MTKIRNMGEIRYLAERKKKNYEISWNKIHKPQGFISSDKTTHHHNDLSAIFNIVLKKYSNQAPKGHTWKGSQLQFTEKLKNREKNK